ncbi:MAG: 50S ribosomal protein L32e [Nanoarchaeota archaeon]|nr:50S ribosomal protein L32e [Nanoarchaeota archaeon]
MEKMLELRIQRKKKKPDFVRKDTHKKKRLKVKWVRPRGLHNKLRLKKRGHRKSISKGYGSPRLAKYLDKSGLEPVLIATLSLDNINPKKQGIIISGNVGLRKKIDILRLAKTKGITVLNLKDMESFIKKTEDDLKNRKEQRESSKKKKEEEKKKRKAESEKKKEKEGIEKTLTEDERKDTEEKKKEEENKDKEKVLTKRS